jgi:hypothetical protein
MEFRVVCAGEVMGASKPATLCRFPSQNRSPHIFLMAPNEADPFAGLENKPCMTLC